MAENYVQEMGETNRALIDLIKNQAHPLHTQKSVNPSILQNVIVYAGSSRFPIID